FQDHHGHPHHLLQQQQQPQLSQNWLQAPQQMIRAPSMCAVEQPHHQHQPQTVPSSSSSEQNLLERTQEDELLGQSATMSNVLYCNMNHPDLRQQFPDFNERFKQIKKIWRKVPSEAKQQYTQQARVNRTKKRARISGGKT
ncbi:unnamed protein product, partial [Didymodactylos carnosus]